MADPTIPREKGHQNSAAAWWQGTEGETAPELRWPLCIPIYDQMRRTDTQVGSVLKAATLPIRRTRWFIEPAGAPEEVARFVADNLGLPLKGDAPTMARPRGRDRFSWDEHLRLALLELPFGHSFFEQVYRVDADGKARIRRLGWRPPRTINEVEVADDGGLVAVKQLGAGLDGREARIPVSQLVAYVNEREGGNWLGQSVLRPAYKFWLLKDRLLRVGVQTVDRNGMGVPVYTAPDFGYLAEAGVSAEEIQRLTDAELARGEALAAAYRSGERAGAALPHGASLKLQGVDGQLPNALEWIRYFDEQIGASVLANFLQLGGADSTGSYALGETFADFFTLSLQAEAMHIADVTNQHVVEDLVDLNFGSEVPAPRVAFDEIGTQQHLTAQAIAQLVACGALLPEPALEDYLRQRFSIPAKAPYTPPAQSATPPAQNRAGKLAADLFQLAREAGWTPDMEEP